MGQRRKGVDQVLAITAHFNAQGPLARGRQHGCVGECGADALAHLQPFEARCGQNNRVVLAFVELAQTGVEVAAQGLNLQVRPQGLQQHLAAQAGGAHHRTLRQRFQAGVARRNEGVMGVFSFHHAGQCEAFRKLHRHVFERVHGDVGAAFFQRHFQLFHEQPLAPHLG